MLHAVKDVHAILFGVARVLKTTRYGEPPTELPPRLTKLVERLESQSGHVKDKGRVTSKTKKGPRGCDPEALLFTVEPDTSLNICGQNKRSTTNSSG
jgi:hypothetical protein